MGWSSVHGVGGGGELAASLTVMLFCLLLLAGGAAVQCPGAASRWRTLTGNAPLVIAKGGFSGIFPDSSQIAFAFALAASAPGTSLWCDLQLTKDGVGICLRDVNMKNCTDIDNTYPNGKKTYHINGVRITGWFSVDYNMIQLQNVILTQAIWSRTDKFDFTRSPILSVTDLQSSVKPSSLWLNVEHDLFYRQHGLNIRSYILSIQKRVIVNYISSRELGFLQSISRRVSRKTKLIYRFDDKTIADPSTNLTYGSLLSNLTFIKTIASGILVPKNYIWPVTDDNYLQPSTSIVTDAHEAGLEIYAWDFANDRVIPYNYSYDPLAEYLSFISCGGFSVDGVLTEFPITASEAIGCFTNLSTSPADHGNPLIISHNGASGDFPDCTDLAYQRAVDDGADFIDCNIQVTSDGIPMCMSSIDLFVTTNVLNTKFSSLTSIITEIQNNPGIFTFNLTWNDISNSDLKPKILSPQSTYYLVRNPRNKNSGKFFTLSDFLAFAKDKDLAGVMIIIENAAFMVKSLGFDVVHSVITALSDAGYSNQTAKEVMIQSSESAVLIKFRQQEAKYKFVYNLPKDIGDASPSSLVDIKKFADAVVVDRLSVFPTSQHFIMRQTNLVKDLQSAGLAVYVQVFQNEFVSQPWDFFSDETVEINNYVQLVNINGFITDFPETVSRYKRNSCKGLGNDLPNYMLPVLIGGLEQALQTGVQPPALAPMPVLNTSSLNESALPPVAARKTPSLAPSSPHSDASTAGVSANILLIMVCATLLI